MRKAWVLFSGFATFMFGWSAQAAPLKVMCRKTSAGSLAVDGLFSDWSGASKVKVRGSSHLVGAGNVSGDSDLSAEMSCLYTDDKVFLRVKVSDEYIVRFKKRHMKQDHLLLLFNDGGSVKKLAFFPPDGRQKADYGWVGYRRRRRRKKLVLKKSQGVSASVIRLSKGYALELSMENADIPGYGAGSPAMKVSMVMADVDSKARPRVQARMGTGGMLASTLGQIQFEGAQVLLKKFLEDQGLSRKHLKMNRLGNIVSGGAMERVVIAKKKIAVLGGDITAGGYFYMKLPVHKSSHILKFAIRDMNGDGQDEILVRLRQMKNNRGREIYVVYRWINRGLRVIFGQEVMHKYDNRVIENKYTYIRHGKGYDMEFSVGKVKGFTQQNHRNNPPKDLQGLLTPWGGKKKIRYRFTSDSYVEVDR